MKSAARWHGGFRCRQCNPAGILQETQKAFSFSKTHPRQEQKKLQLNTFLWEGYEEQTQVSSHISWKVVSYKSKSLAMNVRTGAALSPCEDT